MRDQRANIGGRRATEVHHDVRVNVRDLRVANPKPLQAALVDQATRPDALDLLEDRSGARMNLEPGVTRTPPAQVLLHDAMHRVGVSRRESEGYRQRDLTTGVEDARIVPELHVRLVDETAFIPLIQELGRLEYLFDEHRARTFGRRREEVEVLPHCATNSAGNPHVVLQA